MASSKYYIRGKKLIMAKILSHRINKLWILVNISITLQRRCRYCTNQCFQVSVSQSYLISLRASHRPKIHQPPVCLAYTVASISPWGLRTIERSHHMGRWAIKIHPNLTGEFSQTPLSPKDGYDQGYGSLSGLHMNLLLTHFKFYHLSPCVLPKGLSH